MRPHAKAFFQQALPSAQGGHALVVGENHRQVVPNTYLSTHLDALKADHRLGALALETDPFMQVFFWAYRDGNLPVPKPEAYGFLQCMLRFSYGAEFESVSDSRTALYAAAIDRHAMTTIPYDARRTLEEACNGDDAFGGWMQNRFKQHPEEIAQVRQAVDPEAYLMERLRSDFPTVDQQFPSRDEQLALRNGVRFAYAMHELFLLMVKHPDYMRWVQNVDAVIEAGRRHAIGEDAMAAAIIKACAPSDANVLVQAGHGHIIAPMRDDETANQGTLHKHLGRAGLKTSTAILTDRDEWGFTGYGLRKGNFYSDWMKKEGIPTFDVPPVLQVDADRVIDAKSLQGRQRPFSIASQLSRAKKAYEATPTPTPHVYGPAYVERMQQQLDRPEMQEALSRLDRAR